MLHAFVRMSGGELSGLLPVVQFVVRSWNSGHRRSRSSVSFVSSCMFSAMCKSLNALLSVASREKSAELDQQSNDAPAGERLVRVPIEELQPAE